MSSYVHSELYRNPCAVFPKASSRSKRKAQGSPFGQDRESECHPASGLADWLGRNNWAVPAAVFVYNLVTRMKSREIFGLAVRIIGLAFLYQGLTSVPNAITNVFPIFPHFFWRNLFPSLLLVGWPLLVGYWMLRGAPWLMRLTYGDPGTEDSEPR